MVIGVKDADMEKAHSIFLTGVVKNWKANGCMVN